MALEIERKFLVKDDSYRSLATGKREISQGYLSRVKERTVRVRIADQSAFITIKGVNRGSVRHEFEYEIPVDDARQLLTLCAPPVVVKTRHLVPWEGLTWEVDEFHGANEGLVVAEVELPDKTYEPSLPSFVGQEVTDDPKYYNSNLLKE